MTTERIAIPEDLLQLRPSNTLESVSMSQLARKGTTVLQKIQETAQAVTINVQGQGAMVTVSKRQYDEMVELIRRIQEDRSDDGFVDSLCQRFDHLITQMNRSGAQDATDAALFADPASLNETYEPGATETKK